MHRLMDPGRTGIVLMATVVAVVIAAGGSYAATGDFAASARSTGPGRRIYACVVPPYRTVNLSTAGELSKSPAQDLLECRRVAWSARSERHDRFAGHSGFAGRTGSEGRTGSGGRHRSPGLEG